MTVICINALEDPRWAKFVQKRRSTVFHSPPWLQVLHDTYGFDVNAYLLLNENEEPIAGFPFVPVDDISGQRLISLPFSDFCDPLVDNLADWQRLTAPIMGGDQPFMLRCVHNEVPLADKHLTLTNRAKWHGIDLRPNLAQIREQFHSSAKNKINKASRRGMTVESTQSKELLRAFFTLHLKTRKSKYHYLAQPYHFFENIWQRFIAPGAGILLVAMYQGNVVGCSIVLMWQETLYAKFNATRPDYLRHGTNELLIWHTIEYAKAHGYTYFDYGLSDWDQDGLLQFKRKFATEERTISMLRYTPTLQSDIPTAISSVTPRGATSQQQEFRALLPKLTDLFTDESVPDAITEAAGALLYRYFC